jgi:membrane-associated protease RseP (regulator of RpoE activity)
MATLSLCFFNLLPLPFLDGAQVLDIILESASCRRSPVVAIDLEAAVNSQRPLARQRRYSQAVRIATVIMLCCTAVPAVLQLQ